ncbi:hypothetical protein DFH09DRAFT_1362197 [Mycena vulgaris]|nr:hypothetical protein DFH09DRAFT_1362197 [Mycena vulgaris]
MARRTVTLRTRSPGPVPPDPHHSRPSRYRDDRDAPTVTPGTLSLLPTFMLPPFTGTAPTPSSPRPPSFRASPPNSSEARQARRHRRPRALPPPHSLPGAHLPAALSAPLRVFPGPNPGGEREAAHAIFPVHAVVLAAHCAKVPRLQPSAPTGSTRTASATLPVLPLTLPSPHAFVILHALMYTHRLPPALAELLPSASSHGRNGEELTHATLLATLASPSALHALASHLCASSSSNLSTLMGHAGHVKELWQDMVALGVYDPELWDALDLAWEVVLGALNLAAQ